MTFKSMAHVRLLQSTRSQRRFPTAPVTLRTGRGRTGWCWTRTNPRPSGEQQVGVSINYQYRSLASQSHRRGPSVISAFTLMQTCRWWRTSNERRDKERIAPLTCHTLMQTCRWWRTSNERRYGDSLLSVNCVRSAELCRQPRSRCS